MTIPTLSPITLGSHTIELPLMLAPMAGVTDRPFRELCRDFGAGYVVGEMVASDSRLWKTAKSGFRLPQHDEQSPRAIQIVGYDPQMMANAARQNVELGAQVIDINMGCPAKKVCNKAAGSALMRDVPLVTQILKAVVAAVDVPVTLKTRTGWDRDNRNGADIARIAEDCGIKMLVIHGRTRADKYEGDAEYDTIARIKEAVSIPVIANGDIDSAYKAAKVLAHTGADGIMVGRGAHGRPWLFREIRHFLETGQTADPVSTLEMRDTVVRHLEALYSFYGEAMGLRFARKHVVWYSDWLPEGSRLRTAFNKLVSTQEQLSCAHGFFEHLIEGEVRAA